MTVWQLLHPAWCFAKWLIAYVAQTDKRNLGAKAMLSEIRDIVEKRKAADGTADAPAAAPTIAPPTPDLQLPYNDRRGSAANPAAF